MKLKKKDLPSMVKGSIPYSTVKLKKKDMGKWDEEELSLIIKGYTARQIADHLLDNQKIVDRLHKQINNLPKCFSKECMGCEIDMQRHLLHKILEGKR